MADSTALKNLRYLGNRKDLLFVLVKKRFKERHVGSILGYFWSLYTAIFPLLSYFFVFFFVAKVSVPGAESPLDYLIYVFSGLLPWLMFSRVVAESSEALNNNLHILRQVIFPIEFFSLVIITEMIINFALQLTLLVALAVYTGHINYMQLLLLPIFSLSMFLFCLGFSWMLSVVGFFLRDLKEVVTTALQFMVYFTPVLYSKENIPDALWGVFIINPMTHAINFFRDIFYHPSPENMISMYIFGSVAIGFFLLGYWVITYVKQTIADMV